MRKMLAIASAAMLIMGVAIAPSQAATTKAGDKCTTKLGLTKVNGAKLYCGVNTNAKTKKSYKLAWIKSPECYDGIVSYLDTDKQYKSAVAQMADIKLKVAALDTATQQSMAGQIAGLEATMATLAPVAASLGDGIRSLCA